MLLMEALFEILLQFAGEILLQGAFELLLELGFHGLGDTLKRPRNPFLSTIGFLIWGAIAGIISLFIFPASMIANPMLRIANLIVTPPLVATMMARIGRARQKRGQTLVRLDRSSYAYGFASAMALVRYFMAS